jgi:thiamine pyrophosphate-dependent acetolactate synthase large subunit-like protein
MASALPIAIGTSIATGNPVLLAVIGGGLQMGLAELATIAGYPLPVTVLGSSTALPVAARHRAALGDDGTLGVTLWNPDFSRLADAFQISNEPFTSAVQLASLPLSRVW